jgi:hypothetical protein
MCLFTVYNPNEPTQKHMYQEGMDIEFTAMDGGDLMCASFFDPLGGCWFQILMNKNEAIHIAELLLKCAKEVGSNHVDVDRGAQCH